jgi:hypothetical protein
VGLAEIIKDLKGLARRRGVVGGGAMPLAAVYRGPWSRYPMAAEWDVMIVRFRTGTFRQLESVRRPGETRTDFVRQLVENEIARREAETDRRRREQDARALALRLIG